MQRDLIVVQADGHSGVSAEAVASGLSISDFHICYSISGAIEAIKTRGSSPSFLVVDIGKRESDVFIELDSLAEVCDSSVKVVVAGENNSVAFYRELIKRGIADYFPYPVDIRAIQFALEQPAVATVKPSAGHFHENIKNNNGFAVGFYAAASGNGSSTVALNTAYAISESFQKNTVLVDLDYQFGMIARYLNLDAPYGIKELLEYPDRGIDASLVNQMAVPYSKYLRVIAAPRELRNFPHVSPRTIEELVKSLKSQFTYVVFDIPHIWTDWVQALHVELNHNFLVSELWLRSLIHVTRLLSLLREHNINKAKPSLIINRMGSKFKEAVTLAEFERICTIKPEFLISNDSKTVMTAENQGKAVMEIGASDIRSEYQKIADYIYTLANGAPPEQRSEQPDKKGLAALFAKK